MEVVKTYKEIILSKEIQKEIKIKVYMTPGENLHCFYKVNRVLILVNNIPDVTNLVCEYWDIDIEDNKIICKNEGSYIDKFVYVDQDGEFIERIKLLIDPYEAMKEEWSRKDIKEN